ncbi:MAG TPA: PQQ-binding-like beta-propeller repeat protein [Candidatus Saccharimonadales bacterium]|nr:PQQ-binding-like beta-propeller repeat protein [Candidatus Saccharimonadales bacterium]
MSHEPRDAVVQYPGGIRVRFRWDGSGQAEAVFALSESGGDLVDHGLLVSTDPDQLCRAELRVETPAGPWSVRLASAIFDDPTGVLWDTEGLFVVGYGFMVYAFEARTGVLRWHHRSGTPLVAVLAAPRLRHVLVQTEIETFAIDPTGEVAWRAAHSDVVISAELVGGRLVLGSFAGLTSALDPATGQSLG